MNIQTRIIACCVLAFSTVNAQNLPAEWRMLPDQHTIKVGGLTETGVYQHDQIKTIYLEFDQVNYWTLLTTNFQSGTYLSATMTVDGVVYENVGVSFKGQTSYMMVPGDKKSFAIKTDAFVSGQDWGGYNNFNLNNCFEDPSFLREFLYLRQIRSYIPAAKASFVKLYINGESWGIYPSVQQLNKDFLKEWYLSNDGTNWRADKPEGTVGNPNWGDGTAAINYLGNDPVDYQEYYTLKSTTVADPWSNLIETCDVLNNNLLSDLPEVLPLVLDVDRTLWFLACENLFGDDDSYIFKGKMDYFCYWEIETGRLVPQEYDGNSVLVQESQNWNVFYHADNVNYPLLNKVLNVPEYRQRYLAHMRTLVDDIGDVDEFANLIDYYDDLINAEVQADDKKLYSYSQYLSGLTELQTKLQHRVDVISGNNEVNVQGVTISNVTAISDNGEWITPSPGTEVVVKATMTSPVGIGSVLLHYSTELVGTFNQVQMFDDGMSNDGAANDGIYGASLPGIEMGQLMKFYIEATAGDIPATRSYAPAGAEHDVYYYQVVPQWQENGEIVINEVMASNNITAMDEFSQYEDWIELYNKSTNTVELDGYHLTDNTANLDKWEIPVGTVLLPNEYLIIWCDEDSSQGPLHANFKLSSSGEQVTLLNSSGLINDQATFGQQQTDKGYARVPNGTGDFIIQAPTFSSNNDDAVMVAEKEQLSFIQLYPNPAADVLNVRLGVVSSGDIVYRILDINGSTIAEAKHQSTAGVQHLSIPIESLDCGAYLLVTSSLNFNSVDRFVVIR